MGRKKIENPQNRAIFINVTNNLYKKLEKQKEKLNFASMAHLVRTVLKDFIKKIEKNNDRNNQKNKHKEDTIN